MTRDDLLPGQILITREILDQSLLFAGMEGPFIRYRGVGRCVHADGSCPEAIGNDDEASAWVEFCYDDIMLAPNHTVEQQSAWTAQLVTAHFQSLVEEFETHSRTPINKEKSDG